MKSTINIAGRSMGLGYDKSSAGSTPPDTTPRARGVIKGLSRRARNNLMLEINRLPSTPTRFPVLNFPPGVPIDPLSVRRVIKLLGQRLVRHFPDFSTHWRVEYTGKGVPHIHLLGDFGFLSEGLLTEWLFKAWRKILGFSATEPDNIVFVVVPADSQLPEKVGYFCKDKPNDKLGTMIYCERYGSTGKCTGHFNRAKANLAPVERRFASEEQRKEIETILVDSLEQRLVDITPGVNVPARQAFIDKVASGKDTCLHFLAPEIIEKVRTILGDAA